MSSRIWISSFLVGMSFITFSSSSFATAYSCTGTVDNVNVGMSGNVAATFLFQGGNMPWMTLCNVSQPVNGVSVEACRGILSVLMTAQISQKRVFVWFDNATPNNCSYPGGWNSLTAMGWYYGPALVN